MPEPLRPFVPSSLRPCRCSTRRAFTLVELMVVIGIIALLMGILLVGLRGALGTAGKTRELSNLRQVYMAWQMYSGASEDYLLPGFLDDNTQEQWDVNYRDVKGQELAHEFCRGWAWRLAPYTDNSWECLIGYREDFDEDISQVPVDLIANEPAYGYNAYYMGGWWEAATPTTPPQMAFDSLPAPYNSGIICRSQGNIFRPDQQIVFATSASRTQGDYKNVDNMIVPGAHWVVPSFLGQTEIWRVALAGVPALEVLVEQAVPLNRNNNAVASLTADGATQGLGVNQLTDQRRWINAADSATWKHP